MNLVKESLAKLLAQEDLIVEHRQVETAQFDVDRRVLTLPIWKHSETTVIDSLIAHEVGHALFTPNEDPPKDIPHQFVNITEDIRIEKLMKRRYAGIPKTFYAGYKVLHDEDFFQLDGVNLCDLNLGDRINLEFKIGNYTDIPFQEGEQVYVDKANKIETFEQACDLAREIHAYCEAELEKQQQEKIEAQNAQQEMDLDGGEGQGEQEEKTEAPAQPEAKNEAQEHLEDHLEQQEGKQGGSGDGEAGRNDGSPVETEVKCRTVDSLDRALRMITDRSGNEINYIEIPKTTNSLVSFDETYKILDSFYTTKESLDQVQDYPDEYELMVARQYTRNLKEIDENYRKFKSSNTKEVNYLVKEFECKKAADGYARTTVNRTGVLDTTKLHTYKYNEDLFRKVSTVADSKNHGLIFNIDWSGSMHQCIEATMKQVLTLVSFCRKVGIQYDVYLFSDSFAKQENYVDQNFELEGKVLCRNFNMVNVLTSRSNNRQHERQAKNLFRVVNAFHGYNAGAPYQFSLGGTPLNEAMVAMNEIIPEFKKRTGVQKLHVINLTDGEGFPIGYARRVKKYSGDGEMIINGRVDTHTILRDRQTGHTHKFYSDYDMTGTFLEQLRTRFPECEFMNIRLIGKNDWRQFKRQCLGHDYDAWERADAEWKKTKSFICTSSYYTVQYALHVGALDSDTEFEVAEDANKTQIKRAFAKSLKSKAMNKKILSSFIERIA
tara:strand:+ start:364 stop:2520 length:2157 start_codon:yes stop_codon:yes gene_type:complete